MSNDDQYHFDYTNLIAFYSYYDFNLYFPFFRIFYNMNLSVLGFLGRTVVPGRRSAARVVSAAILSAPCSPIPRPWSPASSWRCHCAWRGCAASASATRSPPPARCLAGFDWLRAHRVRPRRVERQSGRPAISMVETAFLCGYLGRCRSPAAANLAGDLRRDLHDVRLNMAVSDADIAAGPTRTEEAAGHRHQRAPHRISAASLSVRACSREPPGQALKLALHLGGQPGYCARSSADRREAHCRNVSSVDRPHGRVSPWRASLVRWSAVDGGLYRRSARRRPIRPCPCSMGRSMRRRWRRRRVWACRLSFCAGWPPGPAVPNRVKAPATSLRVGRSRAYADRTTFAWGAPRPTSCIAGYLRSSSGPIWQVGSLLLSRLQ